MEVVGFLGGGHAQSDWYRKSIADFSIPLTYSDGELLEYLNSATASSNDRAPVVAMMGDGEDELVRGTCKWFSSEKGFGFIQVEGQESDVFVHQSDIYAPGFRSLAEGEPVEFKMITDERNGKLKAVEVTGPDGAYVQGAPKEPYYGGGGGEDDYY